MFLNGSLRACGYVIGAAGALAASAASAEPIATVDNQLSAAVPPRCVVVGQPAASGQGATVNVQSGPAGSGTITADVSFAGLADQTDATLDVTGYGAADAEGGAPNATISFQAACNFASSYLSLSSTNGSLANPAAGTASGFANAIAYAVRVEWPTPTSQIDNFTGAGAPNVAVAGAAVPTSGLVRMVMRPYATISNGSVDAASDRPLVAGTYSETLRIRLGQNP